MKKLILSLIAVCLFCSITCYAQIELQSDLDNHIYTLSGTVDEAGFNQKITVVVKDSLNNDVFYGADDTDNNGNFSYSFRLSDLATGYYTAYIGAYDLASPQKVPQDIFFVNDTEKTTLLGSINDTKTSYSSGTLTQKEAFDTIKGIISVKANLAALAIDEKIYNYTDTKGKENISAEILANAPYTSLTVLTRIAKEKLAVELIRCAGSSNIETIAESMADIYKFDSLGTYPEYESLTTKKEVLMRLAGTSYSGLTAIRKAFEKAVLLECLKVSQNVADATSVYDKYGSIFEIDYTVYRAWTNRDLAVASYKLYFKDAASLKNTLDTAYASRVNAGNTPGTAGNSGGSSFGGGSVNVVTPPVTAVTLFADLPSTHWASEAIKELCKLGVIAGVGDNKVEPDRGVTREEFAKIAAVAFGLEGYSADCNFADVNKEHWSYTYIASLAEKNIVNGIGNDMFNKSGAITRQDMAVIIKRLADYKQLKLPKVREYTSFNDDANIAGYAEDAVVYLYEAGIINGFEDGSFGPEVTTTRAQAAKIIWGMLDARKE